VEPENVEGSWHFQGYEVLQGYSTTAQATEIILLWKKMK